MKSINIYDLPSQDGSPKDKINTNSYLFTIIKPLVSAAKFIHF